MEDYRQIIEGARPGEIVPIVKQLEMAEPASFFAKLRLLFVRDERAPGGKSVKLRHGKAGTLPYRHRR
jgi:hypothetical protein